MAGKLIRTGIDSAQGIIQASGANSHVTIEGALVGVVGDPVDPHGSNVHANATMQGGSSFVFIDGTPVSVGNVDQASCGHVSVSGSHVSIDG